MASVQKRGKKWYAIYLDRNGKQHQKSGYTDKAATERLAKRLEDEERAIRLGDVDPQADARRIELARSLSDHIQQYKAKLQAANRSDGHVAYTIGDIEALAGFVQAQGTPLTSASQITWPLIDRWVLAQRQQQKAGERGNSNKTINRRVASVKQFLRYLSEVGGVTKYVLHRYPKLPTGKANQIRNTRALDRQELDKLLGDTTPQPRRDLYRFVARTGLRLNEARQVTPGFFDWEHKLLILPPHVTKSKHQETIPLHDALVDLASGLAKGKARDARLFPRIPTRQHVINQLHNDCQAAGVDPKGVGMHALRHTFCTLLARANVHPALLQKLARHRDLKTTLSYYTHLQRSDEREAINKL